VADELIGEILKRPWVSGFRDGNGRAPVVRVGTITDRTTDADKTNGTVDIVVLTAELDRALSASGAVTVPVADGGTPPDFRVNGSVCAADGIDNGHPVRRYSVDLMVVDGKSGEPVCPVSIERAKDDSVSTAPPPVPPAKPEEAPAKP
jgi:hypothetical protein